MSRLKLPDRRPSWTQKVKIGGSTYHLGFGERLDGSLAELFIDAAKYGSFTRGILDTLARMISLSLQCGASIEEVCNVLRNMDFPPSGPVVGSHVVKQASSVPDWIAQEILHYYGPQARKEVG